MRGLPWMLRNVFQIFYMELWLVGRALVTMVNLTGLGERDIYLSKK